MGIACYDDKMVIRGKKEGEMLGTWKDEQGEGDAEGGGCSKRAGECL